MRVLAASVREHQSWVTRRSVVQRDVEKSSVRSPLGLARNATDHPTPAATTCAPLGDAPYFLPDHLVQHALRRPSVQPDAIQVVPLRSHLLEDQVDRRPKADPIAAIRGAALAHGGATKTSYYLPFRAA